MKIKIKPKKINKKNFNKFGQIIDTNKKKYFRINNGYAKRYDNLGKIDTSTKKGKTIVSIFSGPTLQYNFEPEIENFSLSDIEQKTSLGIHFGLRTHLGPLNADLRFDRGINENELSLLEQNGVPISGRIDTRSNVWSIGLSYKL